MRAVIIQIIVQQRHLHQTVQLLLRLSDFAWFFYVQQPRSRWCKNHQKSKLLHCFYKFSHSVMSDEDINGDSDKVQQEKAQKKTAKYDSGAADLEKVTDYAEEKEISSSEGFSSAMSIIGDRRNKEAAEKKAKEKELLKVSISKEDVDLIMKEMEISRTLAEQTLREHRGNVVEALITLTS